MRNNIVSIFYGIRFIQHERLSRQQLQIVNRLTGSWHRLLIPYGTVSAYVQIPIFSRALNITPTVSHILFSPQLSVITMKIISLHIV